MTQLLSTVEDDVSDTRLVSCRVLRHLFTQAGRRLDQDRLHQIYPKLLKTLDDSSDDVRIAASDLFSAYVQCFQVNVRFSVPYFYKRLYRHLVQSTQFEETFSCSDAKQI